jgi:hypothetical protein
MFPEASASDWQAMDSSSSVHSLRRVLAAGVVSLGVGVAWTSAKFASGSGYWAWPAAWWLLAGAWAVCVGLVFLAWRPRLAAFAAAVSLVAAILGGFATLLVWLIVYGTGD